MSWITPISLFTNITETRIVSGRSAALKLSRSSRPFGLDVEIGDLEALALELAHRVEHRLVLGSDRDEVLALVLVEMRRALQGEVDRFGGARGPDDFLRVAAHQPGNVLRARFPRPFRRSSQTNANARPDCRNARSGTESSWPPRAGPPASSPNSRDRSEASRKWAPGSRHQALAMTGALHGAKTFGAWRWSCSTATSAGFCCMTSCASVTPCR